MSALAMAILFRGLNPPRAEPLDPGHDRLRGPAGLLRAVAGRPPTSTPPAGSATRSRCRWPPLVAACGVAVPQLSGRGLGHTGGTLDKLEAIPGWRAALSTAEMLAQLESVGAVICAAGSGLAPADKKLYALRDVTGTVESIPLIASSIMSKKIAEGTGALVLDVKVGSGAFMKNEADARTLAETMVAAGPRRRAADRGSAYRHVDSAGPHRRQRPGGGRVGRGAGRRRAARRGRADRGAGPGDAGRRRAATTATRPTSWPPARRWTSGGP